MQRDKKILYSTNLLLLDTFVNSSSQTSSSFFVRQDMEFVTSSNERRGLNVTEVTPAGLGVMEREGQL